MINTFSVKFLYFLKILLNTRSKYDMMFVQGDDVM